MASITKEITIAAHPDQVWAALHAFDAVHERLAKGFVVDCRPDGPGLRIVTFFNGVVAREALVSLDDDARRLVYTVVESPLGLTHYNAAAQVLPDGDSTSRFVWTIDLLPDDLADAVAALMERGAEAIRTTLESAAAT